MNKVWNKKTDKPHFESLKQDINTDVLIVGGGLSGILCAYKLQNAGIDYTLIEAKEICGGITHNTTAKITAQHGLIYSKIIKKYGEQTAKLYYEANSKAINTYRILCDKLGCDFEDKDAYVYSVDDRTKLESELKAYRKIGISAEFVKDTPLPFKTVGAVKLKNQGQINPLEFLYKLSNNLNIKENTKLINLMPNVAVTDKGTVKFKKAIITTHFPIINKHGLYFLKMYQHRSYVIALENAQNVNGIYIDQDIKGLSFRNYGNLLLLGGGSHRTGKNGGNFTELYEFAKKHYPDSNVKYKWATQDCITLDGMAYIGNYSKDTPDLYIATGFNKWGFTTAMTAAEILCDLICKKKNSYSKIYSPDRSILHPQLALNGVSAVINLLTPTTPRCPHLGCALKYNKAEHTWDCPCHGSRFTEDGVLIDNPSTDDKKL